MKKLIVMFFFIMLSFSVVGLGEIKKINIEKGETITVDLKVKDGVEFNLMDDRHIINVNKITYKGADLDIFNFVDTKQKTMYITVNRERSVKIDLDEDGKGEIYILLNKFFKYDGSNGERLDGVSLDFYYPADEDFSLGQTDDSLDEITGETIVKIRDNENKSIWRSVAPFVVFFVFVTVIIVAIGIYLNKNKKVGNK